MALIVIQLKNFRTLKHDELDENEDVEACASDLEDDLICDIVDALDAVEIEQVSLSHDQDLIDLFSHTEHY